MTADDILRTLDNHDEVLESYVLVREVKAFLKVGGSTFHPEVRVKIYVSNALADQRYHFEVSHLVHTPLQAGPYATSRTFAATEEQAIGLAIDSTTRFINAAMREGLVPEDSWLIPNTRF